jgi:hypothetical protein
VQDRAVAVRVVGDAVLGVDGELSAQVIGDAFCSTSREEEHAER